MQTADIRSPSEDLSPSEPTRSQVAWQALSADLGPYVRRGEDVAQEPLRLCSTGISEIDALLGGGFPRGGLSEIAGCFSSGRTSLSLALLASTTQAGELAAVVDLSDAFDPESARAAGVKLDRILWARARGWREALRCTQCLLETDGFPLVVMDLPSSTFTSPPHARRSKLPDSHSAATATAPLWLRLSRLAVRTRTALVVSAPKRSVGSNAAIALEMRPLRARFTEAPALLEELEIYAVLARHRTAPALRKTSLRLDALSAA